MAEKGSSAPQGDFYPPPPPGPPPGHNGLAMNPAGDQYVPDSQSELYDNEPRPPLPNRPAQPEAPAQPQTQQIPHQPPPPDSDGAPKKASWGQRFSSFGTKAAAPFNMLANKLGSENFLPSSMDKECEKAARILRNFCKDGIYTDAQAPETVEAPTTDAEGHQTTAPAKPRKNRTLLTIPSKVINKAVGLAIFTTARAGFHVSGATGSGVLIARLPDGSWSPPSGIQVHSVGAGFMIGIDIYDCVVVINSREALEAFTKTRMSLGSDLAVVAGPWGAGGSVDFAAPQSKGKDKEKAASGADGAATEEEEPPRMLGQYATRPKKPASPPPAGASPTTAEKKADSAEAPTVNEPSTEKTTDDSAETPSRPDAGKERKPSALKTAIKQPTYSYVKSRGFYAGVQVDGTIVTERKDANAAFYGEPVAVEHILKGEVPLVPGKENWVHSVQGLFDTIKGAEGWRAQPQSQAPPEQQGQWANQMGPDPNSTYGTGNVPAGHPQGYDPVFSTKQPAEVPKQDSQPAVRPPNPPRTNSVRERVAAINSAAGSATGGSRTPSPGETPAARAKAAEAAAESSSNTNRDSVPPPGYTEVAGPGETSEGGPPAYVDDGVARPGVGDSKGQAGGSS